MDIPDRSKKDYEDSPVKGLPLREQIEYWKSRSEFFEKRAYANLEEIKKEMADEEDEADWWRHCDE